MEQAVWRMAPNGLPSSNLGEGRLLVERVHRWVRNRVFRRGDVTDAGSPILLASSNHEGIRAAMVAHQRLAQLAEGGGG